MTEPPFDPPSEEWLAERAASQESEARYYAGEPARDQAERELYEAIEDAEPGAEEWLAEHAASCPGCDLEASSAWGDISAATSEEPEEGIVVYVVHTSDGQTYIGQPRPAGPEPEPGQ